MATVEENAIVLKLHKTNGDPTPDLVIGELAIDTYAQKLFYEQTDISGNAGATRAVPLSFLYGITSAVQTQIDGKLATDGTAANATNIDITNTTTDAPHYPTFVNSNDGFEELRTDSASWTWNPSTELMTIDGTLQLETLKNSDGNEIINCDTGTFATGLIFSAGVSIKNGTTSSGFLKIYEDRDSGTNFMTFKGPTTLGDDLTVFQLPANNGTNGYVLQTNGSGVTSWGSIVGTIRDTPIVAAVNATNSAGQAGVMPAPSGTDEFKVPTGGGLYVVNHNPVYSVAAILSESAILRLTASGTSSGDQDITFAESGGMSVTRTNASTITFSSADTNTTYTAASKGGIGVSSEAFSLDVDGMDDIGAALATGDLFIVDDGAGGTNRKTTINRISTYVQADIVDSAPSALDTLNELAAALGDDANYAATITTALGLKATLASPTFTGTVTIPTVGNLVTAVTANTAKATNATHSGEVTGSGALTIANNAVVTARIADDNVTAAKLANSINTDIATGVTASTTAGNALPKAGGAMTGAITTNSTFDGVDVAAASVLASAALPKGGGAMTGAITTNSTFDGVDVAAASVLASAALPKGGGTMSGDIAMGDNAISNIKSFAFNDGDATITEIKDEDNMSSNSATMLATQQSIKAYVDASAGTTYTGGTNLTLSGTQFNVDDAFLKNNADDTTSGIITAGGFTTTGTWTFDEYSSGTVGITTVQNSSTTFNDNDTSLMTAAAINDQIGSISGGGDPNQNAWTTITVPSGTTSQVADSTTDTITFTAAGGMTITGGGDDTIAFSSANDNDNFYITGLALSSGTVTATVSGAANPTVDLTGLYTAGDGLTLNTRDFDLDAALTTVTSILSNSLKIGRADGQDSIDFGSDDTILFDVDNTERMRVDAAGVDITGALTVSGSYGLAAGDIPSLATSKITSGTFANARIAATNVTQHVGSIVHDSLSGFVADEHLDWTSSVGTIHSDNYTNTTYSVGNAGLVPAAPGSSPTTYFLNGSGAFAVPPDTNTQLTLIDSDTMSGASSSNVASAESVKAYVDANAGGSGTVTVSGTVNSGEYARFSSGTNLTALTGDEVLGDLGLDTELKNLSSAEVDYLEAIYATDVTSAEFDYLDGVTSAIQTQLDSKGTSSLALGSSSSTAYRGDRGTTAYDHSQASHAPSGAEANVSGNSGNAAVYNNSGTPALRTGITAAEMRSVIGAGTSSIAGTAITGGDSISVIGSTNIINHLAHTGEVTGTTSLTITDNTVDEANLKVSNGPTNGHALIARSGNTGGMTWEAVSGGGGIPTQITIADTTDTSCYVGLFEDATGDREPKTDAGLTYNAGTGMLTATGLTGPLTGNASGTSRYVTDATQASITTCANLVSIGTIGTGVWQGTAIASGYIAADAITGAKIADNAIDSEHYTDGSIDEAHMAANSIDSDSYVDGSIDLAHMSANSVDSSQYVDGSIDEAHIANDAVNFATHLKAGTDGELITWDASGNPAAVAVGTSTHVLTSNGAGAAPTFQSAGGGGGGISNIVEDTTPQLGGNLDCLSRNVSSMGTLGCGAITSTGAITSATDQVCDQVNLAGQFPGNNAYCTGPLASGVMSFATALSDSRLKNERSAFGYGISELKQLSPEYYEYNRTAYEAANSETGLVLPPDNHFDFKHVGLMAQDVEPLMPELVHEIPDTGYKYINKDALVFTLINAVKELEARIATLEAA